MKDEKFWREGMDGKRFALCSFRRFWFFGAAGILGAAVSAGLYLLITVALAGPPEYQVFSQYRIYFDSEKYGEIQDYYNAYTWGEIMKTDEVLDYVMEALPEGITKEQVKASVSVGAMNDVKIMPLTITTQDPELSETIAEAYVYGLDRFGHSIEGLSGMDCWLLEDAQEVPRGTKAGNAALLGLILGAAAGFFAWLIGLFIPFCGWLLPSVATCRRIGCSYLWSSVLTHNALDRRDELFEADNWLVAGFGMACVIMLAIPVLAIIFIPGMVLGGAIVYNEHLDTVLEDVG